MLMFKIFLRKAKEVFLVLSTWKKMAVVSIEVNQF